jgi:hypothetical protein
MPGRRTFRDVIENEYYNEIADVLSDYIERNADNLDLSTHRVETPEHAELSDFDIKAVRVCDRGGFAIDFDIILSAEITVSKHFHSDVETDDCEQWFCLTCSGVLNDGLQKFKIDKTSLYSKSRYDKDGRLSESLVPIIAKEQFDNEAAAFLEMYYPDALRTPMPLPVEEVASNMGLTIKRISLTRYLTLFGMTVFADTSIQYYDHDEQLSKFFGISKGTIIVDPDVCFMRNIGCERNTIIHECVHWHKHRKYHELAKMYDPDSKLVACRVSERDRKIKWGDDDWMEWHANGIAPRILMPKEMTKQKIDEYWAAFISRYPEATPLEIADYVILSISDFFQVSKAAAKFRMLDLGYMEAAGLYIYLDDHYLSPFAFPEESNMTDHSYSIGISDAFFEYFTNQTFQGCIDSGSFVYVDGHYVINDAEYVEQNIFGSLILTEYAKAHVDECCLRFDLVLDKASEPDVSLYLEHLAFKAGTSSFRKKPQFSDDDHNQYVQMMAEEKRRIQEALEVENTEREELGLSFSAQARRHMEKSKKQRYSLKDATLLGDRTLQRIANEDLYQPTADTVMALCVGLGLGYPASEKLFAAAGFNFDAPPRHRIFRHILLSHACNDMFECNAMLDELGEKLICETTYREILENR